MIELKELFESHSWLSLPFLEFIGSIEHGALAKRSTQNFGEELVLSKILTEDEHFAHVGMGLQKMP